MKLPEVPDAPHNLSIAEALQRLGSSRLGLSRELPAARLEHFGLNGLPVGFDQWLALLGLALILLASMEPQKGATRTVPGPRRRRHESAP